MSSLFSNSARRDVVWQTDWVKAVCRDVSRLNKSPFARRTLTGLRPSSGDDWDQLLEKFAIVRSRILAGSADPSGLYACARELLGKASVTPDRSRLSFLYQELWEGLATHHQQTGNSFLNDWYLTLAGGKALAPHHPRADAGAWSAEEHFRLLGAEELAADAPALDVWRKRLGGFALQALSEAALATPSEWLAWESAVLEGQLAREFAPLGRLLRARKKRLTTGQRLLARLWAFADPHRRAIEESLLTPGIHARELGPAGELRPVLGLCRALEQAYQQKTAVHARLEQLGESASRIESLSSPEFRAVAYLAVARALLRLKRYEFLPLCLEPYRALSRQLTGDLTDDVFGYLDTLRPAGAGFEKRSAQAVALPTGAIARGGKLGVTLFEIARILGPTRVAKFARGDLKNIELSLTDLREIAGRVGTCLAELRGPLAKLGQMLGHYFGVIDHPLGRALSILHDRNNPVPFAAIQACLESEYGAPLATRFKRVDPNPIGVGTVAQVHRATTLRGEEVALKVKLPRIERVFADDLRLLGTLSPILALLIPHVDFRELHRRIRDGLNKELDFAREREMQARLAAMFENDEDVAIPRVFPELCAPSVIALEFIDGLDFNSFAASASQAERDRMGKATVRFVVSTMLEGCFNSDPNPGNFLYARGKAYFIDFGAVQMLTRDQRMAATLLIRSVLDQNLEQYKIAARRMGFAVDPRTFDYEGTFQGMTSERMGMWATNQVCTIDMKKLIESFRHTTGVSYKPRGGKPRRTYAFPPDYFFFFREYFGHLLLLSVLRARANWHQLVRELTDRHGLAYPSP